MKSELHLVKRLPKVDLHLHLDGAVRPETALELARSEGISLPAEDSAGLLPYMQVGDDCGSLADYLAKFDFVLPLLQTRGALERVARELAEWAAGDGCLYVEVRFAPQLHVGKGLTCSDAIDAVLAGLRRAEASSGIVARAIAICMRHHPEERNLAAIEAAAEHFGRGLVAVDLAGDEAGFPASRFRRVFARARELGIPCTIHAGEASGPDSIAEAIDGLGAVRIGHGVRLREDPALLERIRERRIPLEMCPTSNVQTKAVAGWDDHPLRDYRDRGLSVTFHTDNPTVSGTTWSEECVAVAERLGFSLPEIARLMRNAVDVSFLDDAGKRRLRDRFDRRLAEIGLAEA
ncbi:adenosine deaminase [Cohnella zeiphila]|uniref:adenosine deaminase n=1 Tax=Cohnella zeiphila TaxID=2761120 RepID=A0A7X0SKN5_9BACL|nr:adenosine deaminase [Cohnella zeiphila]MBB6731651.1 adenosine deaminase [Cohnella zeiphila]